MSFSPCKSAASFGNSVSLTNSLRRSRYGRTILGPRLLGRTPSIGREFFVERRHQHDARQLDQLWSHGIAPYVCFAAPPIVSLLVPVLTLFMAFT